MIENSTYIENLKKEGDKHNFIHFINVTLSIQCFLGRIV
jgi:hypothetical protein